jgi:uncharacterized protein (TIGR00255 family)
MIKSMTAFGRAERTVDGCSYMVEMRCLNRRYCEISVRIPQKLLFLEERVKKLVTGRISRGRVDVTVKVKGGAEATPQIEVNAALAKAYYRALCELNDALETEDKMKSETLFGLEGIITTTEPAVDMERTWEALSHCIGQALEDIDVMRTAEGRAIYEDFQKRLKAVEEGVAGVKAFAPSVLSHYQTRLNERIAALTEGKVEVDPNRLAQEAAFLADKSDITEEIVRAESHLRQFRTMIESEGPAGRALDFLLQELNREVNTIGSKAGDAELSHMVVTIKSELEKIREQVQNVE